MNINLTLEIKIEMLISFVNGDSCGDCPVWRFKIREFFCGGTEEKRNNSK
jgi:hypothetical protein